MCPEGKAVNHERDCAGLSVCVHYAFPRIMGSLSSLLLSLSLPVSIEPPKLSSYAKTEDKLFKHLFRNYQKWTRPVEFLNGTVQVKFGLAISQLVDVVSAERCLFSK